ncbi:hypothetical protein [Halopiger goleimassiliensis]|uniref:hypothetical protein n=1 Tax=Halopiger goleimassiliensis TaxID=1293048 RepID=UPI0012B63FF4|nr:hypothetical protein [Halopiger goleimassiliensis]
MPGPRLPNRRTVLSTVTGVAFAHALAGCLESTDPMSTDDPLGERPLPRTLVGDDAYVAALEDDVERRDFPDPDAELVPELTKARFVADVAREEDEVAFADRIDDLRDPLFEPLLRFEAVTTLAEADRRERLSDEEREALLETAGLDEATVTNAEDPTAIVDAALDDRALTFFDYPGPPLHVIEGAVSRGRDRLEEGPDERAASVDDAVHPVTSASGRRSKRSFSAHATWRVRPTTT